MRHASSAQNLLALVGLLQAQHVREAREHVLTKLKTKPLSEWSAEDRRLASTVCATYDVAGIILKSGLVRPEPIIDSWGPSLVRCHELLATFIQSVRVEMDSRYWDDFEWLVIEVQSTQPVPPISGQTSDTSG